MEFAQLVRPAFDRAFLAHATQREREARQEHGEWPEAWYADGRVVFAGRCYDGPLGLVVLDAGNEAEGRRLAERDPSIRVDAQHAQVCPSRPFSPANDPQH